MSANDDHNYDKGVICDLQEADEEEFPPLPMTRSKSPVPKKPPLSHSHSNNSDANNSDAIATFASLINTRSDALEKMMEATHGEIVGIREKMGKIEKRVSTACMSRVPNLERYGWSWNLRLLGIYRD